MYILYTYVVSIRLFNQFPDIKIGAIYRSNELTNVCFFEYNLLCN